MRDPKQGNRALAFASRFVLPFLGVAAAALVIRHAGPAEIAEGLRATARVAPLIAALELLHLGADVLATRMTLGEKARRVPLFEFIRAHLVGYAMTNVLPAGRAAAEAAKGAIFAPFVGAPAAAAAAGINQAASLLAASAVSIVCAIACVLSEGPPALSLVLFIHALALCVLGVGIRALARSSRICAWLGRFRRIGSAMDAFRRSSRETPLVPRGPILAFVAGRGIQAVQIGILATAVGAHLTPSRILIAQGVNMLGASAGDLVPANLGATDGAFALMAGTLGASVPAAVTIAMVLHVVTVGWSIVGFSTLALRGAAPAEGPLAIKPSAG